MEERETNIVSMNRADRKEKGVEIVEAGHGPQGDTRRRATSKVETSYGEGKSFADRPRHSGRVDIGDGENIRPGADPKGTPLDQTGRPIQK